MLEFDVGGRWSQLVTSSHRQRPDSSKDFVPGRVKVLDCRGSTRRATVVQCSCRAEVRPHHVKNELAVGDLSILSVAYDRQGV
jgi:hypothetical protein